MERNIINKDSKHLMEQYDFKQIYIKKNIKDRFNEARGSHKASEFLEILLNHYYFKN